MHRFIVLHAHTFVLLHFIFVQDLNSYNALHLLQMTPKFCTFQTGFGAHAASYSIGTKVISRR
jgi:hypothetical protein